MTSRNRQGNWHSAFFALGKIISTLRNKITGRKKQITHNSQPTMIKENYNIQILVITFEKKIILQFFLQIT